MQKNVIGHVECPVCDHADAQVKEDKNGHAFIFCPDCAAQTFTRNEFRDRRLRARMRPVTVTVTEPLPIETEQEQADRQNREGQEAAKQAVPPVSRPLAPRQQAPKKNAPPVDPAPLPPKKKAGWFTPLIGGE